MQSILCDICKVEIREDAQELTRVSGRVATSQEGGTMIVNRQNTSIHVLCKCCADWLSGAQVHLGDHFDAEARGRVRAG